ncbi:uncharacterized protein [Coffea arabica]|uniref:Reverse transcriptase n=1 Tax=Coffea arabica TaxID=13443 RepID=A0ABM4WMC8_COFAR
MGDMNDIVSNEKKWGGRKRADISFENFRDFINTNELVDIGYEGKPWTWSNRWDNEGEIRERLDRVLGSGSWCNSFRNARCRHLETKASDHSMLLVDTKPAMGKRWKKRFMFDRNWFQHKEVGNIVKLAWNTSCIRSRFFKFQFKIKQCRVALLRWNKQKERNFGKIILQTKKEMKLLRDSNMSGKGIRLTLLKKKLVAAYKYEEDEEETGTKIIQYFKGIFTAEALQCIDAILNEIPQSITSMMNKQLILPVTEQEVHRIVFSMHPNKLLSPDGMTPIFFQKFWFNIKLDLINVVQSFFHSGNLLRAVNETLICLIPKVDSPIDMT